VPKEDSKGRLQPFMEIYAAHGTQGLPDWQQASPPIP